jgi:hypothetical protein
MWKPDLRLKGANKGIKAGITYAMLLNNFFLTENSYPSFA